MDPDDAPEHFLVLEWLDRFLRNEPVNLVMVGDKGRGKSHAAWAAIMQSMRALWLDPHSHQRRVKSRHHVPFAGGNVARALRRVKETFGKDVSIETEVFVSRLHSAPVLLLDDIGVARSTDWAMEFLNDLVDERYENQLPMIVTSNLLDLRAEIGDRMASRLGHRAVVIPFNGPDRRRQTP